MNNRDLRLHSWSPSAAEGTSADDSDPTTTKSRVQDEAERSRERARLQDDEGALSKFAVARRLEKKATNSTFLPWRAIGTRT